MSQKHNSKPNDDLNQWPTYLLKRRLPQILHESGGAINLKETRKWCESLSTEAEARPIILHLVAELKTARKEIQILKAETECWRTWYHIIKERPKSY